ncbi:excisionase family DNA binding protein [Homoserinimonas aerilata]|uniref:Excisionase family DNA binding protein n=1 Tax=Homoserinimonas aerilata TaxID=1162970 RepID=A0A542YL11_9MICO|nr:helix-turn-helix domain-containing protein [Homoserinimonas aerilata]TQL48777.1 excisionase family DNA binding protein [Homoserinimonas aerilata]
MDLLTTAEAAQYLNVPIGTLHYWRSMGTGPNSMKLGRRVMYRRDALDEFVLQQERFAAQLGAEAAR